MCIYDNENKYFSVILKLDISTSGSNNEWLGDELSDSIFYTWSCLFYNTL